MDNNTKMPINQEELKQRLTPEQYAVLRQKGTEAPFSSPLYKETAKGMYDCVVCGNQLFSSDTKYDSEIPGLIGWPSFEDALPGSVELKEDNSFGMRRTEVVCAKCGSHLGHVFDEETETKTGKHYCINGACLLMKKEGSKD